MVWRAALVMAPALALFCVAADLPHVAVFTAVLLLLSGGISKPLRVYDRTVIYAIVLDLVLMVVGNLAFPLKDDRFGFLSLLLHPEWTVPLLFYGAALATFFRRRETVFGLAGAAVIAALAFCGDMQSFSGAGERMPFAAQLLKSFRGIYPVTVGISLLILPLALLGGAWRGREGRVRRWTIFGAAVLATPLLMSAAAFAYKSFEPQLRVLENRMLRSGLQRMAANRRANRIFIRDTIDLNVTLAPELRERESQVVLTATGPQAPGYLRGRVFRVYRSGVWSEPASETMLHGTPPGTQMPFLGPEGALLAAKLFYFDQATPRGKLEYEIFYDSALYRPLLYLPGGTRQISVIADRISVRRDGELAPTDFLAEGGCRVWRDADDALQYGVPDAELSEVPQELRGALAAFLAQYLPTLPAGDRERAAALTGLVRSHARYSLSPSRGEGDPVLRFLTETRAGHCELFASSLVLLLRTAGIPARYVTGFVCVEPHAAPNTYVARLGNAHAWVEAYDRQRKCWMQLEPTPASAAPASRGMEQARQYGEWGALLWKRLLADLRRGQFAQGLLRIGAELGGGLVKFWPVGLGLAIWIGGRMWRRRRLRYEEKMRREPEGERLVARATYLRMLARFRRRKWIARDAEPTAAQLMALVEKLDLEPSEKALILHDLAVYDATRYGPAGRS